MKDEDVARSDADLARATAMVDELASLLQQPLLPLPEDPRKESHV